MTSKSHPSPHDGGFSFFLGVEAEGVQHCLDIQGRISKAGDPDVRRALYEAVSAMLMRFKGKGKDKVKT